MLTPASPWIGSNKKPAVFSFIAAFNASTSPNGMTLNPGSKGPNPRLLLSSEDKLMAAIVLPWKLSTQAMISAWSSCTPLTSYRSEEHTSELQSRGHLVCRLLLEKKNINN